MSLSAANEAATLAIIVANVGNRGVPPGTEKPKSPACCTANTLCRTMYAEGTCRTKMRM